MGFDNADIYGEFYPLTDEYESPKEKEKIDDKEISKQSLIISQISNLYLNLKFIDLLIDNFNLDLAHYDNTSGYLDYTISEFSIGGENYLNRI